MKIRKKSSLAFAKAGPQIVSPTVAVSLLLGSVAIFVAFALALLPIGVAALATTSILGIAITYLRSGRSLFTPTIAFSGIFTAFGLLGYFVYPAIQAYGRTPGHDPTYLIISDDSLRLSGLVWFLSAATLVMAGSWVSRGISHARKDPGSGRSAIERIAASNLPIWFAMGSIALNLLVRDTDQLIIRDTYHIETEIGGVATYLQLPAAFMLGMIFLRRSAPIKLVVLVLIAIIVGFSFALSSRMLSLAILMFFAGMAITARRVRWLPITLGAAAALFLMPIPIYMRGLAEQGLIPNLQALGQVPLFSEESYWSTAGNLLSAFSVVTLTGGAALIPWESLALSILPLPGSVFGVSESGAQLRINFAIPYAGLGEVANQGPLFLIVFFLTLGLLVGWVERGTERLRDLVGSTAETLVPVAIAALTAFLFVQYNLRTAMRLEYVLLFCGIYVWLRVNSITAARRESVASAL